MPLPQLRPLAWTAVVAAALAFAALTLLVSSVDSPQDLVLLRNAVIADVGPARAYDWTPESVPKDYRLESLPAPEPLRRFAGKASGATSQNGDFELALGLARALSQNQVEDSGPIQSDTVTALERITTEGAGYCADYTQVYNALGRAAGLFVREWGMSFDGYGGNGHAFNEVWDRGRQKWLFIDSFYSFYVADAQGNPLSATEFRSALLADTAHGLEIVPINPEKFAFKSASKAVEYYRRGASRFYLIWGNDVLSYDQSAAVRLFSRVSRSAEQLAGIAIGAQPKLLIPRDFADERALTELQRLRLLMGVFALSVAGGCAALLMLRTGRK